MNLVTDIGNTLTKLAVFNKSEMIYFNKTDIITEEIFKELITQFKTINKAFISTVSDIPDALITKLNDNKIKTYIFDTATQLPFINKYKTPETLGKDRIAAVAGAYYLYPGNNVLIVDAGTAITFDLINSKGEYLGGNISPGLDMRFKALNQYTSKLPLLKSETDFSLIGESTNQAIINGVQNGLIFEIEGYIKSLKTTYTDLIILITGGNAQFFEYRLKKSIFVVSNLTLIGLNTILEHNVHA